MGHGDTHDMWGEISTQSGDQMKCAWPTNVLSAKARFFGPQGNQSLRPAQKAITTTHEPSTVNDEDDEYISGKDFPELLNQCQDWKKITRRDLENCKYSSLAYIDPLVKSRSEEFWKNEQI